MMTDTPSKPSDRPAERQGKSSRLRIFLWVAAILGTLFILLLILTPYAIRWGLEKALSRQGAVHARIEDVDFNPFQGKLVITAFRGYPRGAEEKLAVAHTQVNINWLPFWNRRIFIPELAIKDVTLDLTRNPDGSWILGELKIPAAGEDEPRTEQAAPDARKWGFGIGRIQLENVTIRYRDPQLAAIAEVERFHLGPLATWEPEKTTPFDLTMALNSGPIEASGEARPFAKAAGGEARLRVARLPLGWLQPALAAQQIKELKGFFEVDLALSGVLEENAQTLRLEASGQAALVDFALQHPQLTLENGELQWSGTTHFEQPPGQAPAGWGLEGQLELSAAKLDWQSAEPFRVASGVDWKTQIQAAQSAQEGLTFSSQGLLALNQASFEGYDLAVADTDFTWDGTARITRPPEAAAVQIGAEGQLAIDNLGFRLEEAALEIEQQHLQADLNLDFSGGEPSIIEGKTAISAKDLRVTDLGRQLELLRLGAFNAKQLVVQSLDNISAEAIILGDLKALSRQETKPEGSPPFIFSVEKVALNSVSLQDLNLLVSQSLEIEAVVAWLVRDNQGDLELARWLQATDDQKKKKPGAETKESAPAFNLALDQLKLVGNNRLTFTDESISPRFRKKISEFALTAKSLDSREPHRTSDLTGSGKVGEHGGIKIQGTLQPLADQFSSDLKIELANIDMASIDGYLREASGYRLKSGQLNGTISGKINRGTLDSQLDLVLEKFQVDALSKEEKRDITGDLGVPLGKALDMLRNSDGDIKLDIPVQGDLDDPEFRFSKVVMSAFLKAVKNGMISYYTPLGVSMLTGVSLPVGALWVAGKLYDMATAIRFDPLVFPPASSALDDRQSDRLEKMAQMLKDRPEVNLIICGIAVPSDLEALRAEQTEPSGKIPSKGAPSAQEPAQAAEQRPPDDQEKQSLYHLASQRAKAVQSHLMEQAIPAKRLTTCSPDYQWQQEAQPRVELGI